VLLFKIFAYFILGLYRFCVCSGIICFGSCSIGLFPTKDFILPMAGRMSSPGVR